jgi:hypothetical protein
MAKVHMVCRDYILVPGRISAVSAGIFDAYSYELAYFNTVQTQSNPWDAKSDCTPCANVSFELGK